MENDELKRVEELGNILTKRKENSYTYEEYYPYGGNTKVAVDVYEAKGGYHSYANSFFKRRKAKKALKKILKTTNSKTIKDKIDYYFRDQQWNLVYDTRRRIGFFFGGIFMLFWGLFIMTVYGVLLISIPIMLFFLGYFFYLLFKTIIG